MLHAGRAKVPSDLCIASIATGHWGSAMSRSSSRKGKQIDAKLLQETASSKVTVSTAAVASELPMSAVPEAAKQSPAAQIVSAAALLGICLMAFCLRLFSVIKYESVIHEFDPYFNYRVTSFLTKKGFSDTWNWFDDRTWYPLGRVIGGTMYPVSTCPACAHAGGALVDALTEGCAGADPHGRGHVERAAVPEHPHPRAGGMRTAMAARVSVFSACMPISALLQVCVFTAPIFSALCALSAYLLVKEISCPPPC